jgi:non-ribosomal peptide synthetase component F
MRYLGIELPALIIQYKDFVNWQNRFLASEEIKQQEAYWLKQFSGEIPEINLPTDFEITGERRSSSIGFYIDKDKVKRLDAIRRDTEITMFMLMFAIYNILLSKLTGQDDIIIGTFLSGRDSAYIENVIGMYVKTLALRSYMKENLTFKEFLIAIRNNVLEAFRNQDYPFDKLVEKLQIKRRKGRNPLFDTAFNFFSNTEQQLEEKDKEMKLESMKHYGSLFDMVLLVDEKKSCFEFSLGYNSLFFERATIERFIQYFKEIYSTVLDDTNVRLSDIKISHHFGIAQINIVATGESEFNF